MQWLINAGSSTHSESQEERGDLSGEKEPYDTIYFRHKLCTLESPSTNVNTVFHLSLLTFPFSSHAEPFLHM